MSEISKMNTNLFNSYLNKNRTKIDESLVSLRFMKEVDNFIEYNKISQRKLAEDIGYTEAYISQLMSGVKKVNTSFINKLEKKYDIKIEFKILPNRECDYVTNFANTFVELNINILDSIEPSVMFTTRNNPGEFFKLEPDDLFTIENNG